MTNPYRECSAGQPKFALDGGFRNGLENRAFAVEDPQVREYGSAAVVVQSWPRRRAFRAATTLAGSGSRWSPSGPRAAGSSPASTLGSCGTPPAALAYGEGVGG
jgi:hypothetical protein